MSINGKTTMEQIIEGLMNTKVKTINPDKDDIIIIQFPKILSFDVCNSAFKYIQHCFPTRKVVAVRDDIDISTMKQKEWEGLN